MTSVPLLVVQKQWLTGESRLVWPELSEVMEKEASVKLEVGHVEWAPLYRVRYSTDPSVRAVQQALNDNAEAVAQLQFTVAALIERVAALESALSSGVSS